MQSIYVFDPGLLINKTSVSLSQTLTILSKNIESMDILNTILDSGCTQLYYVYVTKQQYMRSKQAVQ